LLDDINTWLSRAAAPDFPDGLEGLYEARLGAPRRRHLALALVLTALAVVTAAFLDHMNSPAAFDRALTLRVTSITLCLVGAFAMLRIRGPRWEAILYCLPLMAQMALAVWVGAHGPPIMVDRNILGSLVLFAVLCSVPPVPGKVARILAVGLFGFFVLAFVITAGFDTFWTHLPATGAGAISLGIGAAMSHHRDLARRRDFMQSLRTEQMADELRRAHAESERLMNTDVLTGVANRRRFETDMARAWPSRHAGGDIGLLLVDVDHFKAFNDCAGHTEGDVCLRLIAGAIAGVVRGGDFSMARWGGEEFVVLAPGIARADMQGLGERVRCAVEALAIPHPAWSNRFVTVSLGAAWCGGSIACDTPEDLLRNARATAATA
jgi:diguanylate cyclase (GGDEF)-like protein